MERDDQKTYFMLAVLILAAGVFVRLYNINGALFEFNPLRQALNAFVARNFAFTPGAMFLLPQADNMGPSPGYLMFELPLMPLVAATFLKVFGQHNWVFRIVSLSFFSFSAVYFYLLVEKLSSRREATLSLLFYVFAPMSILMSRTFQSESLMMFALMFALYHLVRWLEEPRLADMVLWTLALGVLISQKITNLYVFLLMGALFLIYAKPRLALRAFFPAAAAVLVNVWWWIVFPAGIREMFPNEYTVSGSNMPVFGAAHVITMFREYAFSPGYWALTIEQCVFRVFSPPLFLFFAAGLFVAPRTKAYYAAAAWALSAFIFILAVPSPAIQDYYKLHLVPPGAILGALCFLRIKDTMQRPVLRRVFCWGTGVVTAVCVFAAVWPVIKYKPVYASEEILGENVKGITGPDDLVIASYGPDAMLLFYCGRKGWSQYLLSGNNNIEVLETRRKDGAVYFVSGNLEEFEGDKEFEEYMLKNYKLLMRSEPVYARPEGLSLDRLLWEVLSGFPIPGREKILKKLETRSLGYAVFDLKGEDK